VCSQHCAEVIPCLLIEEHVGVPTSAERPVRRARRGIGNTQQVKQLDNHTDARADSRLNAPPVENSAKGPDGGACFFWMETRELR